MFGFDSLPHWLNVVLLLYVIQVVLSKILSLSWYVYLCKVSKKPGDFKVLSYLILIHPWWATVILIIVAYGYAIVDKSGENFKSTYHYYTVCLIYGSYEATLLYGERTIKVPGLPKTLQKIIDKIIHKQNKLK